MSRRGGGLFPEACEREEGVEFRCEDSAHEAELAHAESDGGLWCVSEDFEEVEVVAERSGAEGDLDDAAGRFVVRSEEFALEVGRAGLEIMDGEDQACRDAAFLIRVGHAQIDFLSEVGRAGVGGELDVEVGGGCFGFAAELFEERDAVGVVAVVVAAFPCGAAGEDNRERAFGKEAVELGCDEGVVLVR